MRTSSAKAKGRRLCAYLRTKLLEWAPDLQGGDIAVPAGSQAGADLWLSPAALAVYPVVWECKNQESLNIWAALEQAKSHKKNTDLIPVVCFTRNHEGKAYVALDLEHFLKLVR